jgi:hypothetical protein
VLPAAVRILLRGAKRTYRGRRRGEEGRELVEARRRAQSAPGSVGCSEDRRVMMPGLRERVIAAICAEDWPDPATKVDSATIRDRLASEGHSASEAEVVQALYQLADPNHQDIVLVMEPGGRPTVNSIREGLCAEPPSDTG